MRLSVPIFKLKRRAKRLSRDQGMPLHQALNRIAADEGFRSWDHLVSTSPSPRPAEAVLSQIGKSELFLLGARPGHGKTLLALELVAIAQRRGRTGFFFTLEYTDRDVRDRLAMLGFGSDETDAVSIVTSDDICADMIVRRAEPAGGTAFVVVDYLQLLDQRRSNPPLPDQLAVLQAYAKRTGATVILISQIDRAFETTASEVPTLADVRMPNQFDPALFDKACFLHDGDVRIATMA